MTDTSHIAHCYFFFARTFFPSASWFATITFYITIFEPFEITLPVTTTKFAYFPICSFFCVAKWKDPVVGENWVTTGITSCQSFCPTKFTLKISILLLRVVILRIWQINWINNRQNNSKTENFQILKVWFFNLWKTGNS